jgi:uncharacterized protein (UPF0262 family)
MTMPTSQIARISLDMPDSPAAPLHHERAEALAALSRSSFFQPANDGHGPYEVNLSVMDGRLVIAMKNAQARELPALVLSLSPYRRLIQDYFLMIDSYEHARHGENACKLEAIDMGRRGLHNEGAELLIERLKDKVALDLETARRLFTLICVLNKRDI